MARRSKLKRAVSLAGPGVQVHDRNEAVVPFRGSRDDSLAGMFARRQIDAEQYAAGRAWQRCWEELKLEALRAVDPQKDPVDCRALPPIASDRSGAAREDLERASLALGIVGDSLVRDVLGRRLPILEAARSRGYTSKEGIAFMGWRFRETLDTLAYVFGEQQEKQVG